MARAFAFLLDALALILDAVVKLKWVLVVLLVIGLAYFVGAPKDMGILEWVKSLVQGVG